MSSVRRVGEPVAEHLVCAKAAAPDPGSYSVNALTAPSEIKFDQPACESQLTNGMVKREVCTFKITTKDLLALSEWLAAEGCTHFAMEATGVYWKPVRHVLGDGDFTLVLANAAHVKKCARAQDRLERRHSAG